MERYIILELQESVYYENKNKAVRAATQCNEALNTNNHEVVRIFNEEELKEFAWEWWKRAHGFFVGGKMEEALERQMFEKEWKEKENV